MSKFQPRQCLRCNQMIDAYGGRKVCVNCRIAELQTPEHKARAKAWQLVNTSIRKGLLARGSCEICGAAKSDAHHDDYSKPLSIRWLCRAHHREHHKQQAAA